MANIDSIGLVLSFLAVLGPNSFGLVKQKFEHFSALRRFCPQKLYLWGHLIFCKIHPLPLALAPLLPSLYPSKS